MIGVPTGSSIHDTSSLRRSTRDRRQHMPYQHIPYVEVTFVLTGEQSNGLILTIMNESPSPYCMGFYNCNWSSDRGEQLSFC